MKKLYSLSEAQRIWTKIIELQAKELKEDLLKAKTKSIDNKNLTHV